ncbi:hypothetical protein H5410_041103 [Solanum commersonii]|uniref:Uncharacterized protein n=1 Tax=Solanum commersonii TaxID=4109 RepID=A0A9J5XS29_SOLCO|nr:hypothetical protein H5410_041103 [Solanum commersonii]
MSLRLYLSSYGGIIGPLVLCDLILYEMSIVKELDHMRLNGVECLRFESFCSMQGTSLIKSFDVVLGGRGSWIVKTNHGGCSQGLGS